MVGGQKLNKPLFSQHYLEHRIQACPEWQMDVRAGFEALNNLYLSQKELLPTLSEAQTEAVFIQPALEILGFSYIPQVTTRGQGRAERPDYALFTDAADRDAAYPLQNDEPAFYARVGAIAEAKYWERPLSKVSAGDARDIYKNTNPSFQIASYLTGTGVDWGMLTNGREWRLYYRQASSTATEFYPVDLVELLEAGDLEQFKYFWLFFRREALIKDPHGSNFLERVREGSTTYATQVGNELKALVFDQVFPGLAGGFVADANRQHETVTAEQVYEATLAFLYKLLFLLYAEARNLLPIDRDYRDHSLITITQEAAQSLIQKKKLSQTSKGMYDHLLNLFQIIDRGDPELEVPRYDGGLFHFDFHQPSDQTEYQSNQFLLRFKLSDFVLAPMLDRLARFEGQPIDYSFLGVRQLGSIYEGLLEYRVVIVDRATGKVHLENDKGERKATGSYYTPDYIVKYIVSHTLKPILEQRRSRFEELMREIGEIHRQLSDRRLGVQSQNGLRKDLQRLEREAQTTLLDIKVCDPAMGSGHFLVEAVDYLTDELIQILNAYPDHNPVLNMLEQTRQSILENLQKQGITIHPDRLEPTQLLQRVVMKRCVYGVDLNPMAVELAKVSLWLHSFTIGAPLSFLDHHLRCGNSLIGTTAREAEAAMSQDSDGQFTLLTGPFVGLLRAAEIMRGVSILSDATYAEVEQSERLFREFDQAAKPYKRLLDIYVAKFFGLKRADHFLRVFGTKAITADPKKMNKADAAVYDQAQKLSSEKHFFHWDLEFPEIFIDLENSSWKENPGFDAVIGNPPYIRSIRLKEADSKTWSYYPRIYRSAEEREFDIYLCFAEKGLNSLNRQGHLGIIIPNKWFTTKVGQSLRNILAAQKAVESILDFGAFQVFENVTTYTCLLFLSGLPNEQIRVALLENGNAVDQPLPNLQGQWNIESLDHKSLDTETWSFKLGSSGSLIEKLESFPHLEDIATVFSGVGTRADHVFMMERRENKFYSRSLEKWVELEESLMKPALTGRDIDSHFHSNTTYMLFPYQLENEDFKVITEEKMMTDFPQSALYISHKTNRKILENRDRGKLRNQKNWYRYSYPRNMNLMDLPKIVFPDVAGRAEFAYDSEGRYIIDTCYAILLKENTNISLLAMTSILNSSLMTFFLQQTGTDLRGGYFRMKTAYLNPFPVPEINFTTLTEDRQQSFNNVLSLYQKFQTSHNSDELITQIDAHLHKQPKEADIVHDFLAYLAEQMMELNKQKQAEIKSFLEWLEGFLECPIDTLTNKSKIKNYLGNYYKKEPGNSILSNDPGEPHLSFTEFSKLLKKNQKKISIDLAARKPQETLKKEYQDSLDILLPIKQQLARCDWLIDQIVYKLYELTEDEIAIVEGRPPANQAEGTQHADGQA